MKPLELTVYPSIPECPLPSDFGYAYEDWMDNRSHERQLSAEKRLADSELAAEAYRQMARAMVESGAAANASGSIVVPGDAAIFGPVRIETSRMGELKRFASLPHASETNYE